MTGAGGGAEIRRIQAGEGAVLREVRLRALRDAPSAFASTFDAEVARPERMWDVAAERCAAGSVEATFLAMRGGRCVGLVGVYRPEASHDIAQLVSMWTAPEARGSGIGRALVDAVVEWARGAGARRLDLWVTRGNDSALRLYAAAGFSETDDVQPLPSDPCRDEIRMTRPLGDSD